MRQRTPHDSHRGQWAIAMSCPSPHLLSSKLGIPAFPTMFDCHKNEFEEWLIQHRLAPGHTALVLLGVHQMASASMPWSLGTRLWGPQYPKLFPPSFPQAPAKQRQSRTEIRSIKINCSAKFS